MTEKETKPKRCKFCGDKTEGTIGTPESPVCIQCWIMGANFDMETLCFYGLIRARNGQVHESLMEAMEKR